MLKNLGSKSIVFMCIMLLILVVSIPFHNHVSWPTVFASTEGKATDVHNKGKSYSEYISTIRSLLNQTAFSYQNNNITEAKQIATTAYLDNFEYLEKPIGKEMADKGEDLMRIQLREQIDNREPLNHIQQTVYKINKLLDEVEKKIQP